MPSDARETVEERPPDWSQPRFLCGAHKRTLVLEDGQALQAVLDRAAPVGFPLEGNLLAWVYNPAFVGSAAGGKAWLDFAGGGMAALEDRFRAESYFEFAAFEHPHAVTLLYAVRRATLDGVSVTSTADVVQLIMQPRDDSQSSDAKRARLFLAFEHLVRLWNFPNRLARCRSSAGHLWPQSFDELTEWLSDTDGSMRQLETAAEARFCASLDALAARRFAALP